MLKKSEIVISIKVHLCLSKKAHILNKYGIDITQLDHYDTIEIWLIDAQNIGLVEKW